MKKYTSPVGTIIRYKENYDSMWLEAKFVSGASFKYTINRNGERLELAFSNNDAVREQQSQEVMQWMKLRKGETNKQAFERLEKVASISASGVEVIKNLQKY
jgi:hypothetical protein